MDPGVGSERKPIIMKSGSNIFIGPDNGLFTLVTRHPYDAYEISNYLWESYDISATFHGRDIFAPVAALSSAGEPPSSFGQKVTELVELELPYLVSSSPTEIRGQILYPDRFGNLLTSLGKFQYVDEKLDFLPWVGKDAAPAVFKKTPRLVLPSGDSLSIERTFSDIPSGECGGIIGSSGLIEIAANQSSAAELLSLERGDQISMIF